MPAQSHDRLLKVADSFDVMLGYWDRDQVCRFANKAYETWFGKTREQMLGITMEEFFGPALYARNLPFIRAALDGHVQTFERSIQLPDGTTRDSLATYIPDVVNGEVQGFSVQVTNVSELKRAEARFHAAADGNLSAFYIFDSVRDDEGEIVDFRFAYLNQAAERRIGRSADNVLGKLLCVEIPINVTGGYFEKYKKVAETGIPLNEVFQISTEDILASWLHYQVVRLGDGIAMTVIDVSDIKRAEAELAGALKFNQAMIDASAFSTIVTDTNGLILAVNPATERMLWYTRQEMVGKMTPLAIHDPAELKLRAAELSEESGTTIEPGMEVFFTDLRKGVNQGREWTYVRKDGSKLPVHLTCTALVDSDGQTTGYMGVAFDITERKRQEDYISHIAHHDALTTLPTRTLFRDRVDMALKRNERSGGKCALLLIDLDNFKDINDSLGHHAGDEVLIEVSKRLRSAVRAADTVSRMGGDEFTVLLDEIHSDENASRTAEKILAALGQPMSIGSDTLTMSASIGICISPEGGSSTGTLLKHADVAMYRAKQTGKHAYHTFTQGLADENVRRIKLETALKNALDRGEFSVVYQPQIELASGRVVGVEALVRWKSKELGDVPPSEFIPIAEQCGVIAPLGEWVLETACKKIKELSDASGSDLRLAVNLSPRQLEREGFIQMLSLTIEKTGFRADRLELEITEGVLMSDSHVVARAFKQIQSLGVQTAIDDFGTGFSNISYLLRLHVNRLKVDRTFVATMTEDPSCDTVVSSLINMGLSLGLTIVAEGIETAEQALMLQERGCQEGQGYFFHRPLSAEDLQALFLK